jgi:arginine decarboxylase
MLMVTTPTKYAISAGGSEGWSPLNAFDAALLESKVGNVNIVHSQVFYRLSVNL